MEATYLIHPRINQNTVLARIKQLPRSLCDGRDYLLVLEVKHIYVFRRGVDTVFVTFVPIYGTAIIFSLYTIEVSPDA